MAKIKNSKDLIMLLLYAKGPKGSFCEPIQGQTRLMKMVFLFKNELSKKFNLDEIIEESAFPNFEPYDFGPYSSEVYSDLEFLVNLRFVEVNREGEPELTEEEKAEFEYWNVTSSTSEDWDYDNLGREFSLTDRGKGFVTKVLLEGKGLSETQISVLGEFKKRCCETSLRSLLRYVYSRHGDMTTKSIIRDQILQNENSEP